MKAFIALFKPDPSRTSGPYQQSLVSVTKAGTLFTAAFFMVFVRVYWLGDYPIAAVWVNMVSVLCSLTGYFLISKFEMHRVTAHLVTFAIYFSSAGLMVISGGMHSSSVIWQVIVPVASFIMAGLYAGLHWGGVSFLTVLTFYLLDNTQFLQQLQGFETTTSDLLLDLSGTILAVSIAIWYSDHLKSSSMVHLEDARVKLNFLATVDPLTNTFNRRYFLELSESILIRSSTLSGCVSFLMFDIDHFKKYNDAYGHIIGDQILQGVAQVCQKNLRSDDILGRFGGEEFVILLPETPLEDAKTIAERLIQVVANIPIETDAGPVYASISIGATAMDAKVNKVTVDQMLFRADQAMYRAKQTGRNRVIVWEKNNLQTT